MPNVITKSLKVGLSAAERTSEATDIRKQVIGQLIQPYSTSSMYAVGDFCSKEGTVYKCVSAITTPEAWTAAHWAVATMNEVIDAVNEAIASVASKANVDGNYPTMTVGQAEAISTNRVIEDGDVACPPIVIGIAGHESEIQTGINKFEYLEGKSKKWNQLLQNYDIYPDYIHGVTVTQSNGVLTINGTTTAECTIYPKPNFNKDELLTGHKYLVKIYSSGTVGAFTVNFGNKNNQTSDFICTKGSTNGAINLLNGETFTDAKIYLQIHDLTEMYGAGNEPTTVEEFRKDYPLDYYDYNAGSILSSKSYQLISRGRQQWDEVWEQGYINSNGANGSAQRIRSKNFIPVVSKTTYCFYCSKFVNFNVFFYDSNKKFISSIVKTNSAVTHFVTADIPEGVSYAKFYLSSEYGDGTSYDHDITISIWFEDGEGYDQHYDYREQVVELPNIELRSIPDYINGGEIRDIAYAVGGGKRNVGQIALGSIGGDWSIDPTKKLIKISTLDDTPYVENHGIKANIKCSKYITDNLNHVYGGYTAIDKAIAISSHGTKIWITDSSFTGTTKTEAQAYLSNVYLNYEKVEPEDIPLEENPGWSENLFVDNYGTIEFTTSPAQIPQIEQPYFIEYTISLVELLDSLYLRFDGVSKNAALQEDIDKIVDGRQQVGRAVEAETLYSDREIDTDSDTCPPAVFSSIGGNAEIQDGNNAFEELRGNSVGLNQLAFLKLPSSGSKWTGTKINDYQVQVSVSGVANYSDYYPFDNESSAHAYQKYLVYGHKYLISWGTILPNGFTVICSGIKLSDGTTGYYQVSTNGVTGIIYTHNYKSNTGSVCGLRASSSTPDLTNVVLTLKFIDLTLMFGAGNEPTTIAEFNALFPLPYYEYNAGNLISSKSTSLVVRGKNQFNKGTVVRNAYISTTGVEITGNQNFAHSDYIRVIPGEIYHVKNTGANASLFIVHCFDSEKQYLGKAERYNNSADKYIVLSNACYVMINIATTEIDTQMFRLYYDTPDVEFEEYEEETITLPNIELLSAGEAYDVAYSIGGGKRRVRTYTFTGQESMSVENTDSETGYITVYVKIPNAGGKQGTNVRCPIAETANYNSYVFTHPNTCYMATDNHFECNLAVTSLEALRTKIANITIIFELATETDITVEENPGWQQLIPINNYGTFEFTSEQDIQVPQAYYVKYTTNLVEFLDSAYERASGSADNIALVSDLLPQKSSSRLQKSITLTGDASENWSTGGSYSNVKRFNLVGKFYCYTDSTHLRGVGSATSEGLTINWIQDNTFSAITNLSMCFAGTSLMATRSQLILLIPNSENVSTVEDLRTWLGTHNIVVSYDSSKYQLEATMMNGEITYDWVIKE